MSEQDPFDASTPGLVAFLLARIGYDERVYRGCQHGLRPAMVERLLAECEARRLMVEECIEQEGGGPGVEYLRRRVLDLLALPYADHPDYREEWKP